jgi:CheY-like chemotaxis protein
MIRVLLVEEDQSRKESIGDELLGRGFLLQTARTGMDAIEAQRGADIMVLNLNLPDLDGVEVYRRIRAVSSVPLIGILAVSSEFERVLAACPPTIVKAAHIDRLQNLRKDNVMSISPRKHGAPWNVRGASSVTGSRWRNEPVTGCSVRAPLSSPNVAFRRRRAR